MILKLGPPKRKNVTQTLTLGWSEYQTKRCSLCRIALLRLRLSCWPESPQFPLFWKFLVLLQGVHILNLLDRTFFFKLRQVVIPICNNCSILDEPVGILTLIDIKSGDFNCVALLPKQGTTVDAHGTDCDIGTLFWQNHISLGPLRFCFVMRTC